MVPFEPPGRRSSGERVADAAQLLDRVELGGEGPPVVPLGDRSPQDLDLVDEHRAGRRVLEVGQVEALGMRRRVALEMPSHGGEAGARELRSRRARACPRVAGGAAVPVEEEAVEADAALVEKPEYR